MIIYLCSPVKTSAVRNFTCLCGPTENVQNEATILTAWRKYCQPGICCTFSLYSCVGPSSLLVVPCYMKCLVGVSERFQKCFDRSVLFRYFSLWNDSLGLAHLTLNEVSAKPMYFLASPSLRGISFEKGRLTYIRDSIYNRELKRKLQLVLFERAVHVHAHKTTAAE